MDMVMTVLLKFSHVTFIDCTDGDVRLVGGYGSYEGSVEVCFENLWGLVAETGWNQGDAEVVCRQLGYQTEGIESSLGQYIPQVHVYRYYSLHWFYLWETSKDNTTV